MGIQPGRNQAVGFADFWLEVVRKNGECMCNVLLLPGRGNGSAGVRGAGSVGGGIVSVLSVTIINILVSLTSTMSITTTIRETTKMVYIVNNFDHKHLLASFSTLCCRQ